MATMAKHQFKTIKLAPEGSNQDGLNIPSGGLNITLQLSKSRAVISALMTVGPPLWTNALWVQFAHRQAALMLLEQGFQLIDALSVLLHVRAVG